MVHNMPYKYIHADSKFTDWQKDFYEQNGYIIIKDNINYELIDELNQRFIDICEGNAEDAKCQIIKDPILKKKGAKGEFVVNKLQEITYDPILSKYSSEKSLLDVVENIIGPNITAVHSMLINKPPDSEPDISKHPLHQDLHYFPFRPAHKIVGSWTAMQKVDESNGCLYVVPGSHKSPLYKHEYPKGSNNALYHGITGKEHLPRKLVILEKGDTVFFHPLILHGSGPNMTKNFRRAISVHFADSNCQFINVAGTVQENIKKEVEDILRHRGIELSFEDGWKMKSKLIKGPAGNFQRFESHL
ncbi:phytanoyl-CoA dioxygenase, peroxisomal-like isoform X2 [Diorhabda carinulata]|uniref:phytanoyl-CoA dioxygenase, peroxisomal-like isoform X2 n=2 Tax=Diorhabda carinulata TaxID=1163345 RepID=UPI0025A1FF6B|nr:phytanoyl-CoA dioxygenase, peroxisomal-like isoform X2 [Diorhabda carinulata]